jgi:hypothetical protein
MANYLALYDLTTGYVLGHWVRTVSDNKATFATDLKITINSIDVANNLDPNAVAGLACVLFTAPTYYDPTAGPGVFIVESTENEAPAPPTLELVKRDAQGSGVSGRDPLYPAYSD